LVTPGVHQGGSHQLRCNEDGESLNMSDIDSTLQDDFQSTHVASTKVCEDRP
jgi:hypothetical protein